MKDNQYTDIEKLPTKNQSFAVFMNGRTTREKEIFYSNINRLEEARSIKTLEEIKKFLAED